MNVLIGFNLQDSEKAIIAFLNRLHPAFASNSGWTLDLSTCQYIGPDAATLIAALYHAARLKNTPVKVILPSSSPKLDAFCHFSGLKHLLNSESPPPDTSHPDCVTVPLRQIRKALHADTDPIIRLVQSFGQVPDSFVERLGFAFSEVIQNVEDHSQSPIGTMTCARYIRKTSEVRVAIVDTGLGIGTTLRKKHPTIASNADALRLVLTGGYSAHSKLNNAGRGIDNLRTTIVGGGGSIVLLSEDVHTTLRPDHPPKITPNLRFPGTAVFFTLPINPPQG